MINETISQFNGKMGFSLGSLSNAISALFELPSKYISPHLTPNLILIGASILLGYFLGRASTHKWLIMIGIGVLFYVIMKLMGVN